MIRIIYKILIKKGIIVCKILIVILMFGKNLIFLMNKVIRIVFFSYHFLNMKYKILTNLIRKCNISC